MTTHTRPARRRLTALAVAVLLSGAGAATSSTAADAAAPTPFQTAVASYNMMFAKRTAEHWRDNVDSDVTYGHMLDDIVWSKRVPVMASWLNSRPADIIGLQENNETDSGRKQVYDLLPVMPGFGSAQLEEETPILYRTSTYSKAGEGTFQITKKGVDGADYNRYCSWVLLTHTATGRKIYAFNAHTEPDSDATAAKVRTKSYSVMIDQIKALDPGFAVPFVITGDFNEKSTETKAPYNAMQTVFPQAGITDLAKTSPNVSAVSGVSSFNGMGYELAGKWRYHAIRTTGYRLDYVLAPSSVKGVSWEINTGPGVRSLTADDGKKYPFFADGPIPSDHNAVREVVTVS